MVMTCDGKLYTRNGQARTAAEEAMPPMRKLRRLIAGKNYSTVCFDSLDILARRRPEIYTGLLNDGGGRSGGPALDQPIELCRPAASRQL